MSHQFLPHFQLKMDESNDQFVVRPISSLEVMRNFVIGQCEKLQWAPGKMDGELYWAAGPDGAGFFVGELNGEPVTNVAMVRHSDTFAWVGVYLCDEKYRGKGYAFKTWQAARAALKEAENPQINVCLDAVMTASALYEREGFKRSWMSTFYYYTVESILEAYKKTTFPDDVTITSASQVDFAKLRAYVEDVMGLTFAQPGLLEKWISLPTHKAIVVLGKNSDIIGFGAIRETINLEEGGYRLGPVLAENGVIARLVFFRLASEVGSKQKFAIYVPSAEANEDAAAIATEVKGQKFLDVVRMNVSAALPIKMEKYFGLFGPEILG